MHWLHCLFLDFIYLYPCQSQLLSYDNFVIKCYYIIDISICCIYIHVIKYICYIISIWYNIYIYIYIFIYIYIYIYIIALSIHFLLCNSVLQTFFCHETSQKKNLKYFLQNQTSTTYQSNLIMNITN